jgi:RNA polymerase sigma-70 factor (ECF subfamily)
MRLPPSSVIPAINMQWPIHRIDAVSRATMKSRLEEDRELVELAQTGDSHAFETLMRRYTPPLMRFLRRFMRDSDDVEDVIQETFIRAYMAINRFRSNSAFSTWIIRIGINAAKDGLALRQRQGLQLSSLGDEDDDSKTLVEAQADLDTPEARLETKEALALLEAALETLPEEQRMSFELREVDGLTYEEIAWQMHCPIGTVRSRIHRARDSLAAALRAH